MKKRTIIIPTSIILLVLVFFIFVLRFPPWHTAAAIDVATGLGAKLACSLRFISDFDEQRIMDDLATYSPVTRLLDLQIDEQTKVVTASLYGMGTISATFREGIGCTLDIGDMSAIDQVNYQPIEQSSADLPWPVGNKVSTIDSRVQQQLDDLLREDNAEGFDTRALLIVKDGNVIAESYASGIDANTSLLGWSMAKTITAMMIGNLVQQGLISLDETDMFPQWTDDERANISVENLLNMTSGVEFDETYLPGSDSTKMLFGSNNASNVAFKSLSKYLPDERFSYSSGTTNILSRLVFERLGGSPQANIDYFQQRFARPMQLKSTYFETDGSGVFIGSSYVFATARDWGKFAQLILNNGEINGHRLFNTSFAQAMSLPNKSDNDPRYGYQTWLNAGKQELRWSNLPADAFAMQGNRSQFVLIIPSKSMAIVRLGWTSGWYSINQHFAQFID